MENRSHARGCPEQILAYLPLIANGTCPPDKRAEIETLLEKRPECAEELEQFMALSRVLNEEAEGIHVPSDPLLSEIMERIEASKEETPAPSGNRLSSFAARISEWFSPATIRIAAAFAVLIIIFQFAIILNQSKKIATYHTLSGPAAVTRGRLSLNIIFNPQASEGALRNFLEKYKGQIISGPGPGGVFTISIPKPEHPDTFLKNLKDQKNLILFAEIRN